MFLPCWVVLFILHAYVIDAVCPMLLVHRPGMAWSVTQQGNQKKPEMKVAILVPVEELKPYQFITDAKRFTVVEWPIERLREDVVDTIIRFDQIKGMMTRHYRLRPNEPLYKNDFVEDDTNQAICDKRLMKVVFSIQLPPDRYTPRQFQPRELVDLAVSLPAKHRLSDGKATELLHRIEVIAYSDSSSQSDSKNASTVRMLKVKVTRSEALVLKYLIETGKIEVMKHTPKDDDKKEVLILDSQKSP